MSGLNKKEIRVGTLDQEQTIGAARFGAIGSALPSLENFNVTEGYVGIGYLPEDGFSVSLGQTASSIKEHNLGPVRVIPNGDEKSITIVAMQTNSDNMSIIVGDDHVTSDDADSTHGNRMKVDFGRWVGKEGTLVVYLKDGDALGAWCIPHAQLMESNEVQVAAANVMGWSMKFVAMAEPGQADMFYLSDDGQILEV